MYSLGLFGLEAFPYLCLQKRKRCRKTPGAVWIFRRAWAVTVHKANPVMWQQICKRDQLRSSSGSGPASISNRGFSLQRLKELQQNYCVCDWMRHHIYPASRFCARILCSRSILIFFFNLVLPFNNTRCSSKFWTNFNSCIILYLKYIIFPNERMYILTIFHLNTPFKWIISYFIVYWHTFFI